MVYFLGNWGMGDIECQSCQHHVSNIQQTNALHNQQDFHQQQHLHQTLSISRASELIRQRTASITQDEQDAVDEIALHPLNNQVNFFCFFSFNYKTLCLTVETLETRRFYLIQFILNFLC